MTPEEFKKLQEETNKVVTELRATVDAKNKTESEKNEKIAKMNEALNHQESVNQEITKKFVAQENEIKEMKEKAASLEKALARPNLSTNDKAEKTAELKSFESFVIKGKQAMDPEEAKYLRTDSNVEGGFLAPTEYINEIIKKITEITPARSVCRIRKTSRGYITIPSRTSILTAQRPGQGGTTPNDNSKYGEEKIFCPRLTAIVPITVEMLNDSAFNMESEVNSDVAEAYAKKEGLEFISGAGVTEMEGIITNTNVATVKSGLAATFTADNIINLCGQIKTGYNPLFGLNRFEIAFLRSLKDGMGQYLWQTGIAMGRPNTLNGYPYVEMPDVDKRGADKFPVIFGDFFRGYTIVDGIVMTIVRDPYTLADSGKIRFVFYKGVGGKVVLPEAIVKLKCAV